MSLRDDPNIIEEVSDLRRDLDELSSSLEGGGISGPITTDMIADEAVTDAKVDWSSLPVGYGGNTPNTGINYSSFLIGTYTIPEDGVYFMSADGYINVAGQTHRSICIRVNGADVKKNMTYLGSRHTLSITHTASLSAGDVVSFYLLANAADFTPQLTPSFSIFKVGR